MDSEKKLKAYVNLSPRILIITLYVYSMLKNNMNKFVTNIKSVLSLIKERLIILYVVCICVKKE